MVGEIMNTTASLFITALSALSNRSRGESEFFTTLKAVVRSPFKVIAAFLAAPFLIIRVAHAAKNPIRRWIARIGLIAAAALAWTSGTLIGTFTGSLFIAAKFGLGLGLAFFVGTSLSAFLSVIFSILVLHATSALFLNLSSEEIVNYLMTISE